MAQFASRLNVGPQCFDWSNRPGTMLIENLPLQCINVLDENCISFKLHRGNHCTCMQLYETILSAILQTFVLANYFANSISCNNLLHRK